MTRWGLDTEDGLVPLSLLNCVNKMFMVARSTSERLCLIYTERNTQSKERSPRATNCLVTPHPTAVNGELHSHQKGADGTLMSSVIMTLLLRRSVGHFHCSLLHVPLSSCGKPKKDADNIW
jgi:hypothetical protein